MRPKNTFKKSKEWAQKQGDKFLRLIGKRKEADNLESLFMDNSTAQAIINNKPSQEIEIKRNVHTCELRGCHKILTTTNRFRCHFCRKYFCDNHRIPENHHCKKKPRALRSSLRELHKGNQIIAYGK
jgi:hypothetical protein